MNDKAALLRYAAHILEEAGLTDEAQSLARVRLPTTDGEGIVKAGSFNKDGHVVLMLTDFQETTYALQQAINHAAPGDLSLALAFVIRIPAKIVTKAVVEGHQMPGWLADEHGANTQRLHG